MLETISTMIAGRMEDLSTGYLSKTGSGIESARSLIVGSTKRVRVETNHDSESCTNIMLVNCVINFTLAALIYGSYMVN